MVIASEHSEPNLPFLLGRASGSIVEPKSAPTMRTQPVGTGPYQLGAWAMGSSITLNKWADYRNASAIKLSKVTIRFIFDPAAQAARCSRATSTHFHASRQRATGQFKADPRFTVLIGGSRAKTIVGINERKKPLDDVGVRRAILAADRPQGDDRRRRRRLRVRRSALLRRDRAAVSTPPASIPTTPRRPRSCLRKPASPRRLSCR